ncbi:hypothetical protein A2U01_0057888, partial [Trifolium medium]|nr:hypothetical protein [Trifolium medium]
MHRLLSPEYRDDPDIERTFRILRRNQRENTGTGVNLAERGYSSESEEDMANQDDPEIVMAEPDIIGIANDRARNIRDYAVFDPNVMNTGIVRPKITAAQFEF